MSESVNEKWARANVVRMKVWEARIIWRYGGLWVWVEVLGERLKSGRCYQGESGRKRGVLDTLEDWGEKGFCGEGW